MKDAFDLHSDPIVLGLNPFRTRTEQFEGILFGVAGVMVFSSRPRTRPTQEHLPMKTVIAAVIASTMPCALAAASTELIINEYNSVRDDRWLGCGEGAAGATCIRTGETSSDTDHFLGRRIGNGGDWIEFVVTVDHADVRGWKLQWVSTAPSSTGLPVTDGTDIWFGDTALPQGEFTFSSDAIWSDLRAGTIITITRDGTAAGGLDTDLSFDPCLGDWWINVNLSSTALVSARWNIVSVPGFPSIGTGNKLYIDHQSWWVQVLRADGSPAIPLTGESSGGTLTGVSSNECAALREDPTPAVTTFSNYIDSNYSSFGAPNTWRDVVTTCRRRQNMDSLRAPVLADECASCRLVTLNEYNAVKSDRFLGGGTQAQDANSPPGAAADAQFGRILGNGGNWFELVVQSDGLDMRRWTLEWSETGFAGSITLTDAPFWSNLRIGTIITFIERNTASGGLDTDLSYNGTTDTWVNVNTFDPALVASTASNKPGHLSGQFTTSNDRWSIRARNASGDLVMGRMGAGFESYNGGTVNAEDVCRLRVDPARATDGNSWFDDSGSSSTFGRPNTWVSCPDNATLTQSFAALVASGCEAPTTGGGPDLNGDGSVDGQDLGILLGSWGGSGSSDLNGDGSVDGQDLGILLGSWGTAG
jgi:hypothetical protein